MYYTKVRWTRGKLRWKSAPLKEAQTKKCQAGKHGILSAVDAVDARRVIIQRNAAWQLWQADKEAKNKEVECKGGENKEASIRSGIIIYQTV